MTDEARGPVAIRITRPYASEAEYLESELECIARTGVVLIGAQQRPEGLLLRFELVLRGGTMLLRGEGRVVGFKARALGDSPGLALKFTRLDARSKALVDRASALRDARGMSRSGDRPSIPAPRGSSPSSPPSRPSRPSAPPSLPIVPPPLPATHVAQTPAQAPSARRPSTRPPASDTPSTAPPRTPTGIPPRPYSAPPPLGQSAPSATPSTRPASPTSPSSPSGAPARSPSGRPGSSPPPLPSRARTGPPPLPATYNPRLPRQTLEIDAETTYVETRSSESLEAIPQAIPVESSISPKPEANKPATALAAFVARAASVTPVTPPAARDELLARLRARASSLEPERVREIMSARGRLSRA